MIELDIDLTMTSSAGSISIDHVDETTLRVNFTTASTFRKAIRDFKYLRRLLKDILPPYSFDTYAILIQVDANEVAYFNKGAMQRGRRLYMLFQYLLSKLGL